MRTSILSASFAIWSATFAQHERLTGYTWRSDPVPPDTASMGTPNVVMLQRHVRGQYVEVEGGLHYYELLHLQMLLKDRSAVEANSTVELGTGHIQEVLTLKARSIAPDGTVHELAEEAFKRRTDERDGSGAIYFAFEGLRPGSTVEYYMLSRQTGSLQGEVNRFQFSVPVLSTSYELLVPAGWRFVHKGYNALPTPGTDTLADGIVRHHLELTDVPAVMDERQAEPARYRMYLVTKLDAIPDRGVRDHSGYTSASRNYHAQLYPELEKTTQKALSAELEGMGLMYARDEEDRIRTIDRHVRSKFRHADRTEDGLADLDRILRTGNCNSFGLQRLYANLLRTAGIEHRLVITCDRTTTPFDKNFPAFNYLQDLFFYFPGINKYLDPERYDLGLGYLAPVLMGTDGLFIRSVTLNGASSGIGTVNHIAELPAEATRNDLDIQVSFSPDSMESTIQVENRLTGYYAGTLQNYWSFLNAEQQAEALKDQFDHLLEGARYDTMEVINGGSAHFGIDPLIFKGTVTTGGLCKRAGEDILFEVGELIGPQMEMYAEAQRTLPVDEGFNRIYDRRIRIRVPEGWSVADLAGLNIHKELVLDGQVRSEFRSQATHEGDTISISILERYSSTHVPLEHFEAYRSVINAAADFNKQKLLLHRAP